MYFEILLYAITVLPFGDAKVVIYSKKNILRKDLKGILLERDFLTVSQYFLSLPIL